jgi:hypothetical protein
LGFLSDFGSQKEHRTRKRIMQEKSVASEKKLCYGTFMTNTRFGQNGQRNVAAWLTMRHGRSVEMMPYICPFDLLVDGYTRVEVKIAKFNGKSWDFNIHRHGKVNEKFVDAYILRMENVPGFKAAIHLIIQSPLNTQTVHISFRSLITRYAKHFNDFSVLDRIKESDDGNGRNPKRLFPLRKNSVERGRALYESALKAKVEP